MRHEVDFLVVLLQRNSCCDTIAEQNYLALEHLSFNGPPHWLLWQLLYIRLQEVVSYLFNGSQPLTACTMWCHGVFALFTTICFCHKSPIDIMVSNGRSIKGEERCFWLIFFCFALIAVLTDAKLPNFCVVVTNEVISWEPFSKCFF